MSPRNASQAELMRSGHQTAAHNRWLAAEIQAASAELLALGEQGRERLALVDAP